MVEKIVRSSSFGRKRVSLSNAVDVEFRSDDAIFAPAKKQCFEDSDVVGLHDLPQEILVRIVCGVDHGDLKNLILVSKPLKNAAIIAKKSHFAYSTPRKSIGKFVVDEDEMEVPNAPKADRVSRMRLCGKKLSDISISLFKELALDMKAGGV